MNTVYLVQLTVNPELEYHYIQPNYTVKHWQPEILVFGAKDVSYESSSIKTIHAIKISFDYSFPMFDGTIKIIAQQFVPVYIQYEFHPSIKDNQQIESTNDNTKNSIDGGRFLEINYIW